MNCIQPIAPAELGPMLRPKSDSILLMAARTCQGMPYCAPAPIHSACRLAIDVGADGAEVWPAPKLENETGGASGCDAGPAGADARLGGTTTNVSACAAPATVSATATTSSRRVTALDDRRRAGIEAAAPQSSPSPRRRLFRRLQPRSRPAP